jgi:periplasmic copper chaperone A
MLHTQPFCQSLRRSYREATGRINPGIIAARHNPLRQAARWTGRPRISRRLHRGLREGTVVMVARRLGVSAIVLAVLLLATALLNSRAAIGARIGAGGPLAATAAWVRLPVLQGRPGAGYLTITAGPRADRLIGVSSPLAGRIELHSTTMAGGMMAMAAQQGFDLPAGGSIRFAPGGNHLMLFDLQPAATPGSTIPLTLKFASGARLTVAAVARAGNAAAHQH